MQVLEPNHPVVQEYNKFMKWFEETHPELYDKYSRNIEIPKELGGGVCVSSGWKISQEEHTMLFKVAQSYYHPNEQG